METLHQSIVLDCPAHAVYTAFTDSEEHAEITGLPASIEPEVGGEYTAYNGELQGVFTRLELDTLIVMRWKTVMPDWPEDHFAVVELELWQSSDGTTVEFTISDVPSACAAAVEAGWEDFYWEPLRKHFTW